MPRLHAWLFILSVLGGFPSKGRSAPPESVNADNVALFERKVRPLLLEHCQSCHSTASNKKKGGLLLDTRAVGLYAAPFRLLNFLSLPANAVETHRSLFDGSNCGIALTDRPAFSVQHHPEASPGPQDSHYLFRRFVELMEKAKAS